MKSSLSEFQVHDILLKYVKYLWKELELLKTLKRSAASEIHVKSFINLKHVTLQLGLVTSSLPVPAG